VRKHPVKHHWGRTLVPFAEAVPWQQISYRPDRYYCYTEGVIDKAEFEQRITGLKQRVSQLQERHQAALDAAESECELVLVISRPGRLLGQGDHRAQ
jgi:hypothetical protein